MRQTASTNRVLEALASEPARWRHGYSLMVDTGLRSGSLYPILRRLSDGGFLESKWEEPTSMGRPPRHLYRLTSAGLEWMRQTRSAPSHVPVTPRVL